MNYFQLLDKETKSPVSFTVVDEGICRDVLGTEPHPEYWGADQFNWYDSIGFNIAMGKPLGSEELRNHYMRSSMWKDECSTIARVLDHLEQKYVSVSWSS